MADRARRAPLPQWWWDRSVQERRLLALATVIVLVVMLGGGGLWVTSSGEPDPDEFVAELPADQLDVWERLAECESGSDWSANTGNGYYGGLQFSLTSWEEVGGEERPDLVTRNEQIMRAEFLREKQGYGAWPRCSAALGLG